jgi:hypothetical protein
MGGWDPGGGIPFRGGDSNTHTSETPRSRAHTKAEIPRLENNSGCLGELVNSLGSHCYYLTPLLMRPLLKGVEIAGFTLPNFLFSTKFYPVVFAFLPGIIKSSKPCSTRLAVPRFHPSSDSTHPFRL